MQDLRLIISQNIVSLRRKSGLTQIELAEKLSYSDKAVSKWERGESTPDITVLKAIADIFSVTVDYLISENHPEDLSDEPAGNEAVIKKIKRRRRMITFAESLGGTESLITYPMVQTHPDVPQAMREHLGITETLLRLSVGLEHVDDIIADLAQALEE